MTILILTNHSQYPEHRGLSSIIQTALLQKGHSSSLLDINDFAYDHQCLSAISEHNPDVLITLDLSGFRFRTQSGENALNMLYTKNLNLVYGNRPEYAPFLSKKISLSMIFYDISGINHSLPKYYPNMLYYQPAILKCPDDFLLIWKNFTTQVLLSEALC